MQPSADRATIFLPDPSSSLNNLSAGERHITKPKALVIPPSSSYLSLAEKGIFPLPEVRRSLHFKLVDIFPRKS